MRDCLHAAHVLSAKVAAFFMLTRQDKGPRRQDLKDAIEGEAAALKRWESVRTRADAASTAVQACSTDDRPRLLDSSKKLWLEAGVEKRAYESASARVRTLRAFEEAEETIEPDDTSETGADGSSASMLASVPAARSADEVTQPVQRHAEVHCQPSTQPRTVVVVVVCVWGGG